MATVNEIQDEITEDLSLFEDWDEKFSYIIDLGKKLPPMKEEYKKPENIIKGCQSQVWMVSTEKDGKVYFEGDSDAIITKGLVALLFKVLNGQPAADIANSDLYFIEKIGIMQNLSMTRSNGFASMVKQMKLHALAYQTKLTK